MRALLIIHPASRTGGALLAQFGVFFVRPRFCRTVAIALDFSTCLQEIADSVRLRQLSLWAGSGISHEPPSALPLANELKFYVLEQICDFGDLRGLYESRLQEGKDIGEKIRSYPLEAFLEGISENHDILRSIAEVFRQGSPNSNHITIARLLQRGLVREVLTTNFDLLIEKALEQTGEHIGVNYEVYFTEDEFSGIDTHPPLPAIFKIHGSAGDEGSMRVTLSQVASQRLSQGRAKVLEHFLASERGIVLVLGYSASDDFDINPVLSAIDPKKTIIFVSHTPGEHEVRELPQHFRNFRGWRMICDTNEVTECLRRVLHDA